MMMKSQVEHVCLAFKLKKFAEIQIKKPSKLIINGGRSINFKEYAV